MAACNCAIVSGPDYHICRPGLAFNQALWLRPTGDLVVYYCPVLNKVGSIYHGPHYDDEPCTCRTPRYEANANHAGPWPLFWQGKIEAHYRKYKDLVRREQKLARLARKHARAHL